MERKHGLEVNPKLIGVDLLIRRPLSFHYQHKDDQAAQKQRLVTRNEPKVSLPVEKRSSSKVEIWMTSVSDLKIMQKLMESTR